MRLPRSAFIIATTFAVKCQQHFPAIRINVSAVWRIAVDRLTGTKSRPEIYTLPLDLAVTADYGQNQLSVGIIHPTCGQINVLKGYTPALCRVWGKTRFLRRKTDQKRNDHARFGHKIREDVLNWRGFSASFLRLKELVQVAFQHTVVEFLDLIGRAAVKTLELGVGGYDIGLPGL